MTQSFENLANTNFFSPAILSDPLPFYHYAREHEPVHKGSFAGITVWVVTSYEHLKYVFGHPEIYSSAIGAFLTEGGGSDSKANAILKNGPLGSSNQSALLGSDDPDHKRFRILVNMGFTPARMAKMVGQIQTMVDGLIDGFIEKGYCNFTKEFAELLPIYFIAQILGLEEKDYGLVRGWSDATLLLVGKMGTEEQEIAAANTLVDEQKVLLELVRKRREQPREDMTSYLVHARGAEDERLADNEIVNLLHEMVVAGNETVRNTLSYGMTIFDRESEVRDALARDESIAVSVVEEVIRLTSPLAGMWRQALADTELGGVKINSGDLVNLRIESGNLDSRQFVNPEKLDYGRENIRSHIGFGYGIHACLGQALARRELCIAFPKLLSRLKNVRVDKEKSSLDRVPHFMAHAIGEVHLTFEPGSVVSG